MFTIKKEDRILIYFIDPVSGITSRKEVDLIRYFKNSICKLILRTHCKDWSELRLSILYVLSSNYPWYPCFLEKENKCSMVMSKE